MPTAKKTAAKKTAPKPVAKEAVKEDVNETVPAPAPVDIGEAVEKDTLERIAQEETKTIIIPRDPRFPKEDQFWEYCINGVIYRYRRGVPQEVPATIYDSVVRKLRMQEESAVVIAEYGGSGKKLN